MTAGQRQTARLIPGSKAPELDVPLLAGGRWRLSEQKPEKFTLIHVFRGVHCTFCQPEVEKLQTMMAGFAEIGVSLLSLSMDSRERAERARDEWNFDSLPFAYGLTEEQARSWGLFLSPRVKDKEPELFAEPAAFLVNAEGLLHAEFQSSVPWMRMDLDTFYRGIQVAMQRGTPPRGTHV